MSYTGITRGLKKKFLVLGPTPALVRQNPWGWGLGVVFLELPGGFH